MRNRAILSILAGLIFVLLFFLPVSLAKAQDACTGNEPPGTFCNPNGQTGSALDCNNPFSQNYTSQACVEFRLGLSQIKADTIVIARDPNSIIVVAFRIFLYIVITLIVGRIVWLGMQISGVGDDADKRKELFMQLVYILFGLIISIGALGITFVVQNIFFGKTFTDQIIKCSDLPANASQELKDKCKKNVGDPNSTTTPTSTPRTRTCPDGTVIPWNGICPI